MSNKVVTRIPPSPTGTLHIGTARVCLFNYLFTRQHDGKLLFRSEDTDTLRSKKEYEEEIQESLKWLGITWDDFSRQSERKERYTQLLEQLVQEEKAYISKEPAKDNPDKEVELVRLKNSGTLITFNDLVRGDITFDTTELGDFVIARALDDALYHFAVVVDDMDGSVTHVIRGEDHISNTPRQILIQEALGAKRPQYAHIPLILAPDRTKLSKRRGATGISEYREMGYLPEALINYLALLGWNPGTDEELFSLDKLIKVFSLEGVQKGGAIFDRTKLDWFNRAYIQKLETQDFIERIEPHIPDRVKTLRGYTKEKLSTLTPILKERIHTLSEMTRLGNDGELDYFFEAPSQYEVSLIPQKEQPAPSVVEEHLRQVITLLDAIDIDNFTADTVKSSVWPYADREGRALVLWPMRVALSGKKQSPDPFTLAAILGKKEALSRLVHAAATLEETKTI